VLADEVNRAPAKVQSALLEAMAEHQISVGLTTYALPELFMVMATQNPIEQEGTYPLPEAQMDRFLMHVMVGYPSADSERQILQLSRQEALGNPSAPVKPLSQASIFAARAEAMAVHMAANVEEYLIQLVLATRSPATYSTAALAKNLELWLDYGASPRATIALDRCSRAQAWLEGRDFVTPDDVRAVVNDVLRHRLILSFEAEATGVSPDQVIDTLVQLVPSA